MFVSMYLFVCFCFFFFQAEDGIRDHCVTGVQTCALPIWGPLGITEEAGLASERVIISCEQVVDASVTLSDPNRILFPETRSEERRVGKECRYRVSTYH